MDMLMMPSSLPSRNSLFISSVLNFARNDANEDIFDGIPVEDNIKLDLLSYVKVCSVGLLV
jgi:hypothetical protein